jgi:CheY-like chemotaxis protein/AraC-like DNA-binding protein
LIIDDNPSIHRDFELVFLDESEHAELDADEWRLYGTAAAGVSRHSTYRLEHASSGPEGIEKVTQQKAARRFFQVAFVDIRMPGMDGVETIERVWRIDSKIQIVICTAYADYSQEDLIRKLGSTDKLLLLKKPFDAIEVTQLARTLSEKWYLGRQAALKLEQMELLIARRTQQLLELQRAPAVLSPGATPDPLEQPVVLLVESGPELGLQISQTLKETYQVVVAEDGPAGFDKAREIVPDLVIAGGFRSHLDGIDLCRRLKADLLTSHIPVILLSQREAVDEPLRALDAGADDYIRRPFQVPELKTRVAALLEARRQFRPRLPSGSLPHPRDLAANQTDARFLQRLIAVIEQNLSDSDFDVDALARSVAVSRRQLFRKLKASIDTTPKALIRSARLQRAAQLLAESEMTITEITFAVGFEDLKHFRALFKEEFGILPSEYIKKEAPSQYLDPI